MQENKNSEDIKNQNTANGEDKNKNSNDGKENQDEKKGDDVMIPKTRLDEVTKQLRETKTQLDAFLSEKQKVEEQKLTEQGEFKKLAEQKDSEITRLKNGQKASVVKIVALKFGTVDADTVLRVVDLEKIPFLDNGEVDESAVSTLIEEIKTTKPFLFGEAKKPSIGAEGGSPSGDTGKKTIYTREQLRDSKFYTEHKADILLAMQEGRIQG